MHKKHDKLLEQFTQLNPIHPQDAPPDAEVGEAYQRMAGVVEEERGAGIFNETLSPQRRRRRTGVLAVLIAVIGVGVPIALLAGVLPPNDGTALASPLRSLDSAGVLYFPDVQVFVVADGIEPFAVSAIIPSEEGGGIERVLYCPSSGWFEGPNGEKFDHAGDYALGPAESGLMRVGVTISGDTVEVDPTMLLGAPPRFVDDPSLSPPDPAFGPFCADPLKETREGFAATSTDIGALLGVWFDRAGSPVPGVWNDSQATVISPHGYFGECPWEDALFLDVGWPLGTPSVSDGTTRTYVRDPDGVLEDRLATGYDADAVLPDDAIDTGYHRGDWHLWTASSRDDEAIFLVNANIVEMWPLLTSAGEC